jgi:hypothetical protein
MKKLAFPAALALCFVLSGCIDVFQHLTRDANGIERNIIKVTVSKAIFAMANGLSGSGGDIDYEELLDESSPIGVGDYGQFGATVERVNDTMDIGYLVDMNIDYRDRDMVSRINRSNTSFIPKYSGKNIAIHIDRLGEKSGSAESDAMAAAFLATGKYRLAINKKCVADIEKIIIQADEGELDIGFIDLYDEYLVEIPIPIIFMSDVDIVIYSK